MTPDAEKFEKLGIIYERLGDSQRATRYYKRASEYIKSDK
jgi:Flp pilus assembly protein TadD